MTNAAGLSHLVSTSCRTALCLEQGVVVLPLHDGLLVAETDQEVARAAMHEAFKKYTGGSG